MTETAMTLSRRVRITLEGVARTVHLGPSGETLRVEYAGGTLLVRPTEDVTVENLPTPRTWTDGDVVAGDAAVYQRRGGRWRGVTNTGLPIQLTDEDVTEATDPTADGPLDVLRYQAADEPEDPAA